MSYVWSLLLSFSLAGASPSTYPITPCPLRELCDEAELIVHARVRSVTSGGESVQVRTPFASSEAALDIRSVLKGVPREEALTVSFRSFGFCPEPARYEQETSVIAFLSWNRDDSVYETHCLSYGSKTLSEPGCRAYATAIREYFAIQETCDDERLKSEMLLDWTVDLAAHPATRWEGASQIAAPVVPYWAPAVSNPNLDFGRLTLGHIQTLRGALFATEDLLSPGTPDLIRVVRELGDPDLAGFLVKFLETRLNDDEFARHYELTEIMYSAARAGNNREAHKIAEAYEGLLLKLNWASPEVTKRERKGRYRLELTSFIEAMCAAK